MLDDVKMHDYEKYGDGKSFMQEEIKNKLDYL